MDLINELPEKKSLSESLREALQVPEGEELTIGRMVDSVQEKGFGFLLLILSLPSALPIPAPGYSTPFGIVLALLGIQMIAGRSKPWLWEKGRKTRLSRKFAEGMVGAATKFLGATERFIKPRFSWVGSEFGQRILGILVVLMAGLMILPIPYTNTFPAMVIFAIGVGLCEDDGLVAALAFVIGAAAIALYAWITYLLIRFGPAIVESTIEGIKETIKGWFGGSEAPAPSAE